MTPFLSGTNLCCMETTKGRRPGRPPKYGTEPLSRREILVEREVDQAAMQTAQAENVSVTEVYRRWITQGRAAKRKDRK